MRLHLRRILFCASLFAASASSLLAQDLARGPSLLVQDTLSRNALRRTAEVQAVERTKWATVNIHSERNVAGDSYTLNPAQNRVNGMGTGIIIDPRGYIVTNQHVVDDVTLLRIRLADGTSQNAVIISRNPETDLALIKIETATPLPTMPLGTSQDLLVGETVLAIGNAYGYEHTVSRGIVSAIKRDVSLNKDMSYKALIQTDASINPGNSGGPLVNIHGELVGVNVAIRAGAQGIGFAIPVDHMIKSVGEMLQARRRQASYDGLVCKDRVEPIGENLVRSVVIERVEANSPASVAGLKAGDQILQVAETKVVCSFDIERGLLDRRTGELIPITVRRQDKEQRLDLVLGSPDRMVRPASAVDAIWTKLGMQLAQMSNDNVARVNRQLHGGLEVTAVNNDGPAGKAGIRKGDILVGLHHWETVTLDNVTYVLGHPDLATFNPLSFYILRGGQVRRGYLNQSP